MCDGASYNESWHGLDLQGSAFTPGLNVTTGSQAARSKEDGARNSAATCLGGQPAWGRRPPELKGGPPARHQCPAT